MEKASGKKLRAKTFAEYIAAKLDGPKENLSIRPFTFDVTQLSKDVRANIRQMEANKDIGSDGAHVEILKANPDAVVELLSKIW